MVTTVLRGTWWICRLLANGELQRAAASPGGLVACPVDELFGVTAPEAGNVPRLEQLQPAAKQLLEW